MDARLLPSYSTSDDVKAGDPQTKPSCRRGKTVLFYLLAVSAVMYVAFSGITRLHLRFPQGIRGPPCHRNFTTGNLPSHHTLPSRDAIPSVALGVWRAGRREVREAVRVALDSGYRHIDGAWIYGNEKAVGDAIRDSSVPRENIWLTSKLWNTFHAPEAIEGVLDDTLAKLGTDYLDLYLIHWPVAAYPDREGYDRDLTANPYPTWQKLEEMVEKGKVRNIGLSNFNVPRIKNLTANSLRIKPAINQVELNFWNPQPELLKWSKENHILLEAYSPLGSAEQVKETLSVPEVKEIANTLGITPAQVIISWHVQRGTVVLPKSVTPSRIKENLQVSALPGELFEKLENAATSHEPRRLMNPSKSWGLDFDIFDDYPTTYNDGGPSPYLQKRPDYTGGVVGKPKPEPRDVQKRPDWGGGAVGKPFPHLEKRADYPGGRDLEKRPEYDGDAVGEPEPGPVDVRKRADNNGGAVGGQLPELAKRPGVGKVEK